MHYGDNEPGVWHTDAPNSLLHMALSIRGTRTLLSRVYAQQSTRNPSDDTPAVRSLRQAPGDVYVSTPASFAHAVEYSGAATHGERILAIQVCIAELKGDYAQ